MKKSSIKNKDNENKNNVERFIDSVFVLASIEETRILEMIDWDEIAFNLNLLLCIDAYHTSCLYLLEKIRNYSEIYNSNKEGENGRKKLF